MPNVKWQMENGEWWHIRCFIRRVFQLFESNAKMVYKPICSHPHPICRETKAQTCDAIPFIFPRSSQGRSFICSFCRTCWNHFDLVLICHRCLNVIWYIYVQCTCTLSHLQTQTKTCAQLLVWPWTMEKGKKLCFNYDSINNKFESFDSHRNWNVFTTTTTRAK